jgi:hypothetical protein
MDNKTYIHNCIIVKSVSVVMWFSYVQPRRILFIYCGFSPPNTARRGFGVFGVKPRSFFSGPPAVFGRN